MKRKTTAPRHLRAQTRAWYEHVVEDYELEDHHLRLLEEACTALDRAQAAREILAKEGLTYTDRFGAPRAHPAAAIARDSARLFSRLVRELGLDLAPDDVAAHRRSGRARAAGRSQ